MLTYVKRVNEIEISFYNIARFIIVPCIKNKSRQEPKAKSSKSLFTDNSLIGHFSKAVTKVTWLWY